MAKENRDEFIASANKRADNDDEPKDASADTYLTLFMLSSYSTQNELLTADFDHEELDSTSVDELARVALPKKRIRARKLGNKKHRSKISDFFVDEDNE